MSNGLKVYNQDKILTIDSTYRGIALKRIIDAKELPKRQDVFCFINPYESFQTGNLKARTINTGSDEFRMFAIGPVGKLQEKAIQIIKAGKELLLAYKSEADIEGIAIYTYGYYTPKQYGNCGLQVYNGDGDLVFDSNQAPLLLHASTIEDSGHYDNGTDLTGISSFDAEMAAIMISPDIEVLGATGEPFADFIQFYVRIVFSRARLYLGAAWPGGLTASAVRGASITHMLVDTSHYTRRNNADKT